MAKATNLSARSQRCPAAAEPACEQPDGLMHSCPLRTNQTYPEFRCTCCFPCEQTCTAEKAGGTDGQ